MPLLKRSGDSSRIIRRSWSKGRWGPQDQPFLSRTRGPESSEVEAGHRQYWSG